MSIHSTVLGRPTSYKRESREGKEERGQSIYLGKRNGTKRGKKRDADRNKFNKQKEKKKLGINVYVYLSLSVWLVGEYMSNDLTSNDAIGGQLNQVPDTVGMNRLAGEKRDPSSARPKEGAE